jgi:hypothetical protein
MSIGEIDESLTKYIRKILQDLSPHNVSPFSSK